MDLLLTVLKSIPVSPMIIFEDIRNIVVTKIEVIKI